MIARIGRVPRSPVIELEGMGSIASVGEDFDQVQWPAHQFIDLAGDYLRQHVRQKTKEDFRIVRDTSRFCGTLLTLFQTVEPHADVLTINRATGLAHWNHRQADKISSASARRELTPSRRDLEILPANQEVECVHPRFTHSVTRCF